MTKQVLKKDTRVSVSARQVSKPAPKARTTRLTNLPSQIVEFYDHGMCSGLERADVKNVRMMRYSGEVYGYIRRNGYRYRAWRMGMTPCWRAYPAPR